MCSPLIVHFSSILFSCHHHEPNCRRWNKWRLTATQHRHHRLSSIRSIHRLLLCVRRRLQYQTIRGDHVLQSIFYQSHRSRFSQLPPHSSTFSCVNSRTRRSSTCPSDWSCSLRSHRSFAVVLAVSVSSTTR